MKLSKYQKLIPVLLFLLTSCVNLDDETTPSTNQTPNNQGFESSTHIWAQESVTIDPQSGLGIPYLNDDNTVSYLLPSGSSFDQSIRVEENGNMLDNEYLLDSDQETELKTLMDISGKEMLDNGNTVRFVAETADGNMTTNTPDDQFYLYLYVNDGQNDVDRIQLGPIGYVEVSAGLYTPNSIGGYVTYSDENEIYYTYGYYVSIDPVPQYKVAFIILNDQYQVVMNSELNYEFQNKVLEGVYLPGGYSSTEKINTVTDQLYPAGRAIQNQFGDLVIMKSKSGNFYYVAAAMDHNPSYKSGSQIILQGDFRTHLYRYNLNGAIAWEKIFTSHLPTQNNYRWFYLDRYLITNDDQLIFSGLLDPRGRSVIATVSPDGAAETLFMYGYIYSFNQLSDGKIGLSGKGLYNNGSSSFAFTGVLNPDLSFTNTNLQGLSDFFY